MGSEMGPRSPRPLGALLALLLLGACSGCGAGASLWVRTGTSTSPASGSNATEQVVDTGLTPSEAAAAASHRQRPGTCRIAPPQGNFPTGEWTASKTILSTNAVDSCAGEHEVRPWDFRHVCHAGRCETYLLTESYYGVDVALIEPKGHDRYLAVFQATIVPCPHRAGEAPPTNTEYSTMTLSWSARTQTLHGMVQDRQTGPCGGGPPETASYVATRTSPSAEPPAAGPWGASPAPR